MRRQDGIDLVGSVHVRAKPRPRQSEPDIQDPDADPAEPRIARINEAVSTARQLRRSTDQRGHVRVAADNPIKGDKIGRFDLIRERDKVADDVPDAIGMTLPLRLPACSRDVGARCVDIDGRGGTGPQEFVMDRTHPTANVEDGLTFDTALGKRLDQRPSEGSGAFLAVGVQLLGRVARIELAIERRVARRAAVHDSILPAAAATSRRRRRLPTRPARPDPPAPIRPTRPTRPKARPYPVWYGAPYGQTCPGTGRQDHSSVPRLTRAIELQVLSAPKSVIPPMPPPSPRPNIWGEPDPSRRGPQLIMPIGRPTPLASPGLAGVDGQALNGQLLNGQPLFVAELHLNLADLDDWPLLRSMLEAAGERLAVRGEPVRFLRGTYLPEDSRLLCLFKAPTAESVRGVLAAANLQAVRIGAAVDLPDVPEDADADR
jgi:hypothetical protein